jgi:hypothetical protein
MPIMVSILFALAVVGLLTLAAYLYLRARALSGQLEENARKPVQPEPEAACQPKQDPPAAKPERLSDFDQARLAAHREAEQQADALLSWESEGGRVVDLDLSDLDGRQSPAGNQRHGKSKIVPDQDDLDTEQLWLDLGGEGG